MQTNATQSKQPAWAVPLVTTYTGLFQVARIDVLGKDTPAGRTAAQSATVNAEVVSIPRLGGLHHRYDLAA